MKPTTNPDERLDFCVHYEKGTYQEDKWHNNLTREGIEKRMQSEMSRRGFTIGRVVATCKHQELK